MAVDVGSAVGYLDLDISGFLANLKTAQSEASNTTNNIATSVGKNMTSIGKSLTSAGTTLTKSVTVPVVGLGTAIITTGANFESAMSKVSAISGATGSELDKLSTKAREMGAKTKFSATESAEAFQYMAMAGWDTEDMLNSIEGVMNLAAASGEELASVSDIVTDAMTAFGLSADGTSKVLKNGVEVEVSNCTRFVDALAAASNSSNTNVSMLGESFKYVAPVAGALGYSVEDVAIALGLMANQGIKASSAGTSLRTLLTNMAKPTDTMAAAMEELGVSLEDGEGNMLSLMDVMVDLREGFGGGAMDADEFSKSMVELDNALQEGQISQEEYEESVNDLCTAMYGAEGAHKAQLAAALAGKTGMAGLLAIVNSTDEDFQSLTESIYNASGTSQEMADIMQNNLLGQFTILKSTLQELALQFSDIMMPYIKQFVSWIQELVQKLQSLSEAQKEQIAKFASFAAAIGPVLLVIGKLSTGIGNMLITFGKVPDAISKLKTGFTGLVTSAKNVQEGFKLAQAGFPALGAEASKLGAALAGITAPMVAIVAGVGMVIAAFATLWKTNEEFRDNITNICSEIKETFSGFVSGIVERFSALGISFQDITNMLWSIWSGFCDLLAPIFTSAFQLISDTLSAVLDVITGILDVFIGIFTGNWEQAWNGIKEIFGAVWDWMSDLLSNVLDTMQGIMDAVCGWFSTTWDETWSSVKQFFVDTWNSVVEFFNGIADTITTGVSNFINTVIDFFEELPYNIGYIIGYILGSIAKWAINMVAKAKEMGSNFVSNVVNFFTQLPGKVLTFITTTLNNVKTWAVNMPATAKTAATNFVNNVASMISQLPSKVATYLTQIISKVTSWATNMGTKGKQGAKNMFNNVKNGLLNLPSTVASIGKNIVQGLWNGISGAASWLYNKVASFAKGILNGMKSALGIHSPSKAFRDQIGKWLPPGIGEGFEDALPSTMDDIKDSFNKNVEKLRGKLQTLQLQSVLLGTGDIGFDTSDWDIGGGGAFDYETLAWHLAEVLKQSPIQPQVHVEMEDGDILLDNERVGRKVAPVVSRVVAQGT